MPGDFPAHTITAFQSTLNHRFIELFHERWKGDAVEPDVKKRPRRRVVLPVGLLLVVDEENGGDATAQELVKRFNLLHVESQNAIDFYFLGWEWRWEGNRSKGIQFNPEYLRLCRDALRTAGVKTSGGNAELILVDAVFEGTLGPYGEDRSQGIFYPSGIALNFKEAIYVNMSKSRDEKEIPSVGDFLQSIIQAAKDVTDAGRSGGWGCVCNQRQAWIGHGSAVLSGLYFGQVGKNNWGQKAGCCDHPKYRPRSRPQFTRASGIEPNGQLNRLNRARAAVPSLIVSKPHLYRGTASPSP